MDVAFYWGGNRTSYDHLTAALEENQAFFEAENVIFSTNSGKIFRPIFAANKALKAGDDIASVQKELFERLSVTPDTKRILLIDPKINGSPARPIPKGISNPKIAKYINGLKQLFEGHDFKLHIEIRNPATLIPSAYSESVLNSNYISYQDYLSEVNADEFIWSPHIQRLQGRGNKIAGNVWRYEDYPKMWRDIVGAFTGVSNYQDLAAPKNIPQAGLSFNGAQLLYKYTQEYSDFPAEEIEKAKSTFLKHFAYNPGEVLEKHFTPEDVEALTHKYEDDWYYIERMENLNSILPREY